MPFLTEPHFSDSTPFFFLNTYFIPAVLAPKTFKRLIYLPYTCSSRKTTYFSLIIWEKFKNIILLSFLIYFTFKTYFTLIDHSIYKNVHCNKYKIFTITLAAFNAHNNYWSVWLKHYKNHIPLKIPKKF